MAIIRVHVIPATEKYVTKGGDFIANYEPNKPVEKSLRSWAATEIIGKKRKLPDLVAEQPRLIFGYQRLQDDVNAYNRDLEAGQVQQFPEWLLILGDLSSQVLKRVSKDITGFGCSTERREIIFICSTTCRRIWRQNSMWRIHLLECLQ